MKIPSANAGDKRPGFNSWVGKIPWRRHGNSLRYSCLENPVDRGAWRAAVHRIAKSQTLLKWLSTHARRVSLGVGGFGEVIRGTVSEGHPRGWTSRSWWEMHDAEPVQTLDPDHRRGGGRDPRHNLTVITADPGGSLPSAQGGGGGGGWSSGLEGQSQWSGDKATRSLRESRTAGASGQHRPVGRRRTASGSRCPLNQALSSVLLR